MSAVEEVLHVIRLRDPRLCRARELVDESAVELRAPALVRTVVDAAASAVDELEVAAEALAVRVLVLRENGRRIPRVVRGELRAHAALRRPALLGRDDDDPVRRARAVWRCRNPSRRLWRRRRSGCRCDPRSTPARRPRRTTDCCCPGSSWCRES